MEVGINGNVASFLFVRMFELIMLFFLFLFLLAKKIFVI